MAHEIWEQREIAQADKQIQAIEEVSAQLLQERKRKRLLENTALSLALIFCLIMIALSVYTDGRVLDGFVNALQSLENDEQRPGSNLIVNCRHPRNRNTPYCLEQGADVEATWRESIRTRGSTSYQFTLHGKESQYKKK